MAKKKFKNPWNQCKKCLPAKCCTYFSLEVDEPEDRKDFDAMLWQIAHKGVSFYIYRKAWYMMVDTICEFLTPENKCAIYETRPYICKEHSIDSCEYTGDDYGFTEHFKSYDELLAWVKENTNFRFKDRPNREAPSKSNIRPLKAATA